MDLWSGSLSDFLRAAESGALPGDMTGQFVRIYQTPPSPGEVRSWSASIPHLASALRGLRAQDIGVRVGATGGVRESAPKSGPKQTGPSPDVGVTTEYHLPLSGQRLDVLLCGRNLVGVDQAIVVELKQCSSISLENEFTQNILMKGAEYVHPSQQALDYADWLANYHTAFVEDGVAAGACSFLHNLKASDSEPLRDARFSDLLERSPLFAREDVDDLAQFAELSVGHGEGSRVLKRVTGGGFRPAHQVLDNLERVMQSDERWHLVGAQRQAYNAILAEVQRLKAKPGRSAILVRGGPGTGKTVIAVQLLADALRLDLRAAHVTGGKAFTTTLRGKFKGADRLFQWNMNMRQAPFQGLDLLLVDEAHRVRETSDFRWTKSSDRGRKSQAEELLDAAKVTVFLLDENQFVRPDEVGSTRLVVETTGRLGIPLRSYDLTTQFRCGGCAEYIAWVDRLLGFGDSSLGPWSNRYRLEVVDRPEDLDHLLDECDAHGERGRIVSGFCWKWSDPRQDDTLVEDVQIGAWRRPWNKKALDSKRYRPNEHPYALWAETPTGRTQIGCIYSAQGFEFARVGVIWGLDLVWRSGRWMAQTDQSFDRAVKHSESMLTLVRNAYRVLLTRGIKETRVLCLDAETRAHLEAALKGMR